jgi:hypothetical protein
MQYEFEKYFWVDYKMLGVTTKDEKYKILERLDDSDWTPQKVQKIIDGIQRSKDTGIRYEWASEDIHLVALEDGVYFFDLIARRANKEHPTGQDLDLEHDEFIDFMKDFKEFIEDNT